MQVSGRRLPLAVAVFVVVAVLVPVLTAGSTLASLLFLPQFFGPPALRIAHGVLLAAACVWLAWDAKRVQPAPVPA